MHLPAATWVHLQYMLGVDWMSITLIWNGFVIAFLFASVDDATAECAVCGSKKSERILTRSSVCWIRIARPLLLLPSTSTWQPGAICPSSIDEQLTCGVWADSYLLRVATHDAFVRCCLLRCAMMDASLSVCRISVHGKVLVWLWLRMIHSIAFSYPVATAQQVGYVSIYTSVSSLARL